MLYAETIDPPPMGRSKFQYFINNSISTNITYIWVQPCHSLRNYWKYVFRVRRERLSDGVTNRVFENRLSVRVSRIICQSITSTHQLTANTVNNDPRLNESLLAHTSPLPTRKNDLHNTHRFPKASELSPPFFGEKK